MIPEQHDAATRSGDKKNKQKAFHFMMVKYYFNCTVNQTMAKLNVINMREKHEKYSKC